MRHTRNFASEYVRWSLGMNLFMARRVADVTQEELGRLVGVPRSIVSRAERGQVRVSTAYVKAVLRACRVPKDWGTKHWWKGKPFTLARKG